MPQTLILGRMPKGADPKSTLASGPWCFSGLEADYPNFSNEFRFAPEPLTCAKELACANQAAKTLTANLIPILAAKLAPNSKLPPSYWEVLLIPWLGLISQQIIERWLRILLWQEKLGEQHLRIPIVDVANSNFTFRDEPALTLYGALGLDFNHWLFSYLLTQSKLPKTWELIVGQAINQDYSGQAPKPLTFKSCCKIFVKNLLRQLPVPHLKGLTLTQSLLFSLALMHKSKCQDYSRLLQNQGQNRQELIALNLPDILPIVLMTLPRALKELKHPNTLVQSKHPKLRIASVEAYEDVNYRQDLAIFRGQGNRLVFIQHGGNYGQISYACLTEMFEYQNQAFITWGWSKQEGCLGNFIPLPYPQLAKIKNAWHGQESSTILFIGTEMPLFGYRLDSHPTPLQMVSYRQAKLRFLEALPPNIQEHLIYRPYFDLPGTLEDYSFIKDHFPKIKRCQGPLLPHVLNARLLILDHHGTSLLEAMAANIPVIFYWQPEHWPLNQETLDLLARFKDLSIYHETPESAALAVKDLWPNLVSFWQSSQVQEVRQAFCQKFARIISTNENPLWVATLRKL